MKTLKWIYRLGVRHERWRVRILIAQFRTQKPERPIVQEMKNPTKEEIRQLENYAFKLSVWRETGRTLNELITPHYVADQQMPKIPLDDMNSYD
jgi:hypothetical protein